MSVDEVRVDPDDLIRKAGQLDGIDWGGDASRAIPVVPPDATTTAHTAVDNLNDNATTLEDYQKYGIAQGRRLAETLRSVAAAYAAVDRNAMDNINKTVPGETPAPPTPVTPAPNSTAAPTPPGGLPTQKGMTEAYLDVESAQAQLLAGDRGGALHGASTRWAHSAAALASAAEAFEIADVNWEGEAADAAYRQFADYRGFLLELSGAWGRLATEAAKIAGAHASTLGEHTTVFEKYEQLKTQLPAAFAGGGSAARVIQNKMAELQHESETVRDGYMRTAQPDEVRPPAPAQNTGTPPTPVLGNGDPRQPAGVQRGGTEGSSGSGSGAPAQQGGGGGGAPAQDAQRSAASPMSAAQQAGEAAQQAGGSPEGGSPGGGSLGGGQPGSGSPGGGMPGGMPGTGAPGSGLGSPKLPSEPALKPAALGGRGGGGSGAGGGGVPVSPLQPAVGAETVAPVPNKAAGVSGAAAGAGAGGGATGGGGMNGMAPMGHGAQNGSSEKKRNPLLSQDEELYTEDRPWTEAVIGNRARRRGAPDDRKES